MSKEEEDKEDNYDSTVATLRDVYAPVYPTSGRVNFATIEKKIKIPEKIEQRHFIFLFVCLFARLTYFTSLLFFFFYVSFCFFLFLSLSSFSRSYSKSIII
jgi:hypothetical protein